MPLVPAWPAPDHPSWRDQRDYSRPLAQILTQSFQLISRNRVDAYLRAVELIVPYLSQPVLPPQRLRVCYVLASGLAAIEEYDEALLWLDEPLELAIRLEDTNAVLDLVTLRSALHRAIGQLTGAVDDIQTGLTLLDQAPPEARASRAALKLNFTAHLAGFEYFLGHFDAAEALLAGARELIHDAPHALLDAATIEWVQTHLHRLRGRPEEAFRTSLAAATAYTESGSPISAARAQALVAETAMDFAAILPADADRSAFLAFARPHLSMAGSLVQEAKDPAGSGMITLTRVRYSRLGRSNVNRIAQIERVIRRARRLDDVALLAEAYTSLGDELAALGETESARNLYQQVLAMLDGSDIPAVGIRAQQALMRARDWE